MCIRDSQYTVEELQAWPVPKLEVLRQYADSVGTILGRMSTEIALHVGQIAYLRGIQRGLDK